MCAKTRWPILLAFFFAMAPLPAQTDTVPELSAGTLDAVLVKIVPRPEELAWREIPWRPALWPALGEAAETQRPVLLWAMNGHPLGCT